MFEKLPYTNFHDLNLDWIIKFLKEIKNKLTHFDEVSEEAIETITTTSTRAVADVNTAAQNGTYAINNATAAGEARLNEIIDGYSVHRRVVLLADSYGGRINAAGRTIAQIVQGTMQIADEDFYSSYVPGAAFAHADVNGKFLTQLENCTISDKDTVTDIVVVGGANDANYYMQDTLAAIQAFNSYAKANYRIAKVIIVGLGLTFTPEGLYIKERANEAFVNSTGFGVIYPKGCKYVLMNSYLLESDRCHPNREGVSACAVAVCNALTSYSCNVSYWKAFATTQSLDLAVSPVLTLESKSSPSLQMVDPSMDHARMTLSDGEFDLVQVSNNPLFSCRFNLNAQTFTAAQNIITCELGYTLFVGRIIVGGSVMSPVGLGVMVDGADPTNTGLCKIYFKYDSEQAKCFLIFEPVGSFTLTTNVMNIYGNLHLHV